MEEEIMELLCEKKMKLKMLYVTKLQPMLKKNNTFITSYILDLLIDIKEEEREELFNNFKKGIGCNNYGLTSAMALFLSRYNYEDEDRKVSSDSISDLGLELKFPSLCTVRSREEIEEGLSEEEIQFYSYIMCRILEPTNYITSTGIVTIDINMDMLHIISCIKCDNPYLMEKIKNDVYIVSKMYYLSHSYQHKSD
ncbi:Hypothetical protein ORPV_1069 [Orpheovirus IHUMI-LCC2]|uniref:Uncharacterized protein n=1 Tax=Orpheovirus IHUMI-LCC2 TaxID=2023057 RepID=A0A2I2L606_9VIRU|nr:Hypothetical protein ORPV_1069 [Orpheovirus IHUMI-LCC2]SNW62973.1 Hypothetical protein ORPV_1069 [Orpheovirus IHUMI-LCC2]